MSERRLKLGHRKEYKRKSKHTRNPSYYPRHLTKVTLADFDALTKSVGDIEAGITVTFSDGVTPVTMEYLTNEINNAHYRLSITSRCITVNHGYGQLYPLVKRIDYERTIQEMARETSYTDCIRYLLVCSKCGKLKRKRV